MQEVIQNIENNRINYIMFKYTIYFKNIISNRNIW